MSGCFPEQDVRTVSQRCPINYRIAACRPSGFAGNESVETGDCPAAAQAPFLDLRELARNTGPVGYICQEAQQRNDVRRWLRRRQRKVNDPQLRQYVCRRLKQLWSPDRLPAAANWNARAQRATRFPADDLHVDPPALRWEDGAISCVSGLPMRDKNDPRWCSEPRS